MSIAIYVGEKMVQILLPDQVGVTITVLSDGGRVRCVEKEENFAQYKNTLLFMITR